MDQSSIHKVQGTSAKGVASLCGIPDNFPAKVIFVDAEGQIAYASNKILALLGGDRKDIIGSNIVGFVAETTDPKTTEKLLRGGTIENCPFDLALPTGVKINTIASAEGWVDPDGAAFRVIELTDVTGLQQSDEELLMKSFRLQSCVEGTNAGTWEWNVQTGETRFNERWAEIVGYRLEELEPVSIETWMSLAHPDDLELSGAKLEKHFAGEEAFYDIDSRMRHKDGHDVWVRDRGRVFSWTSDGKPEWMFGTHFLIDREKRFEQEQRRNLAMLDRMAKVAGVGGWEVDIDTGQVLWSDETKRIHGVPIDYVPNLEEGISFYAPDARPIISAAVEEGMKSGKPWDLELPFIRQNGERIWVRAVGEVEFEAEKPKRIVGAFQDITTQVHDRNELIAAKEWTSFAAAKGRVGLWSLDAVVGQLNWDQQMAMHFGYALDSVPNTVAEWLTQLHEDSRKQLRQAIRSSMFAGADMDIELTLDLPNDEQRVVKLVGSPHMDQDGTVDRLQGACFDLTEHRKMVAKLEEQASKLSVTLKSIRDGVITTDGTGCITWMNPEAEKLTEWTTEAARGLPSDDILKIYHQMTGKPVHCPIKACLQSRDSVFLQPNSILRRANGTEIAIDDSVAPLFDNEKRIIGAVMVFRDTTKQRDLSRDIEFRANHDQLTGLLNRDAFLHRLEACVADPLKQNGSYLLFVDLDYFKRINDSLGHEAGDAVLSRIGAILQDCATDDAIVARIGGDEFAILLRSKDKRQAESVARQICIQAGEGSFLRRISDTTIRTGASVGIVSLGKEPITAAEALRRADIAAYSAKNNGRGQYCVWSDSDSTMVAMSRQTSLINLIEAAIEDCSWIVQEQCIQDMKSTKNEDVFAELLIRLPDQDGKMIDPADFLPAAERYGLMVPIDLWMCEFVLKRVADEQKKKGRKTYSVNISASSLSSQEFRTNCIKTLSAAPSKVRKRVCIEVTETAILKCYEESKAFLSAVRALGVRVAIDDFGAGSTSFRHFQNLPADYLKIDGSFIQHMDEPVEAASIECFIRMAKVANLKTIAEHVENSAQIKALNALNIDFAQGFAFGRPH